MDNIKITLDNLNSLYKRKILLIDLIKHINEQKISEPEEDFIIIAIPVDKDIK